MFHFLGIFPDLSSSDRIALIQERMKAIQKRYMELKAEVTYLDRKRRRARRKEREGKQQCYISRFMWCEKQWCVFLSIILIIFLSQLLDCLPRNKTIWKLCHPCYQPHPLIPKCHLKQSSTSQPTNLTKLVNQFPPIPFCYCTRVVFIFLLSFL